MYLSCLTHVNEVSNVSNSKQVFALGVFISHEKYVSIINTEFSISIMSTPTIFFPFSGRNHLLLMMNMQTHLFLHYLIYLKSMLIKS